MYLTIEDLKKGIYGETLQTITRDQANAEQAIIEAQEVIKTYLAVRYDIAAEFEKTGDARNIMIVKMVKDIAIYNCYMISSPVTMPEVRLQCFNNTIKLLKDIQREQATIQGLSRLDAGTAGSNYVKFGGNTKRNNSF